MGSSSPERPVRSLPGGYEIQDLRRREGRAYLHHVVATAGEMDRRLGLLERTEYDVEPVFRPGVWFVLWLFRAAGRPRVRFLVAVQGSEIVGTTVLLLVGPWAYVGAVGVSPEHRRRGLAEALMAEAEASALRWKKPWLVLDVDSTNQPAHQLYLKLGWKDLIRTSWWELPVPPPGAAANPGSFPARTASAQDLATVSAASAQRWGVPLPPRIVHPIEFTAQSIRGRRTEAAWGPVGAPSYLLRSHSTLPQHTAFLIGVPGVGCSEPEIIEAMGSAARELALRGVHRAVVPVVEGDDTSTGALTRLGASPIAASMTMGKRAGLPRS